MIQTDKFTKCLYSWKKFNSKGFCSVWVSAKDSLTIILKYKEKSHSSSHVAVKRVSVMICVMKQKIIQMHEFIFKHFLVDFYTEFTECSCYQLIKSDFSKQTCFFLISSNVQMVLARNNNVNSNEYFIISETWSNVVLGLCAKYRVNVVFRLETRF